MQSRRTPKGNHSSSARKYNNAAAVVSFLIHEFITFQSETKSRRLAIFQMNSESEIDSNWTKNWNSEQLWVKLWLILPLGSWNLTNIHPLSHWVKFLWLTWERVLKCIEWSNKLNLLIELQFSFASWASLERFVAALLHRILVTCFKRGMIYCFEDSLV